MAFKFGGGGGAGGNAITEGSTISALYTLGGSGQLVVNNNTQAKVNFDTLVIDTNSAVSNASTDWVFTAPEDGIYIIHTSLRWDNDTNINGAEEFFDTVLVDGVNTLQRRYVPNFSGGGTAQEFTEILSGPLNLTAGDEVYLATQHDSSGNKTIRPFANQSYIYIYKIPGT